MAVPSLLRSRRARGELLPSHDIWEPFGSLRRDMEHVFEDFLARLRLGPGRATRDGPVAPDRHQRDRYRAQDRGGIAQINEKDVEVVLGHGRLTIKGEKKQQKEEKKKDYHMVERSYGFVRPFDRAAVRGGSEIKWRRRSPKAC